MTLDEINEDFRAVGMITFMGIQAEAWDAEQHMLTLSMPYRSELRGGADEGHFHGGAIGAFIDTAATYAVLAADCETAPTVNYRVDFIRPASHTALKAVAVVRRLGRSLAVSDVDVFNDAGKLVAVGRATFKVG